MSRIAIRSSLAALGFVVAAAGMSGTAMAAPDPQPTKAQATQQDGKHGGHQRHGHHGKHRAGHAMRDAVMVPGVGPLSKQQVESLKLDAKQQSAFDAAKQAQGDLFKAMRDSRGQRQALLDSQLKSGKLDPRALVTEQDARQAEFHKQSEAVRGQWLAAWDGLNVGQQKQVTEWVQARQEKLQAFKAKKQERQAKREAARAGQTQGSATPPATSPVN
jgi:protein CpxP